MSADEIFAKCGQLIAEADARFSRALIAYSDNDLSRGDDLMVSAALMFNEGCQTLVANFPSQHKAAMEAFVEGTGRPRAIIAMLLAAAMSPNTSEVVKSMHPVIFDYIPKYIAKQMLAEHGIDPPPGYKDI